VALVVMVAFLDRNGIELSATNAEALAVLLDLAAGDLIEAHLTRWIAEYSRPL
jgi:prophage maintenance system killer protein